MVKTVILRTEILANWELRITLPADVPHRPDYPAESSRLNIFA